MILVLLTSCKHPNSAYQGSIWLTGDLHGLSSVQRILNIKHLKKQDVLIVLGDFGLIWDNSASERAALDYISRKPFTTLFLDGNHENFRLLYSYPVEQKFGGLVRKIRKRVYHLPRGEVFEILGKKIFVFGGGFSTDYKRRVLGVNWWKEEIPSELEKQNAYSNLSLHNYKVDIVLSHVPNMDLQMSMMEQVSVGHSKHLEFDYDETAAFLALVGRELTFDKWYCGHFHVNDERGKFVLLYDAIVKLE